MSSEPKLIVTLDKPSTIFLILIYTLHRSSAFKNVILCFVSHKENFLTTICYGLGLLPKEFKPRRLGLFATPSRSFILQALYLIVTFVVAIDLNNVEFEATIDLKSM